MTLRERGLCAWQGFMPPREEVRHVTSPSTAAILDALEGAFCTGREDRSMLALEVRPPSPASGTQALPVLRDPWATQEGEGTQRTHAGQGDWGTR